ncbi:VOC family protein [Candidatus Gracilibacteria bacterium]|nr:VOC family protein [Candidatus Gracilibacteria bacterium]
MPEESFLTKTSEFRLKLYPANFGLVKEFYRDVLQFPIVKQWDDGPDNKGVMFSTGVAIIELLSPDQYAPVQGCAVSLRVADVDQLWEKLKDVDFIEHPLRNNSWGDRSFCIKDPEGFKITFFSL